MTLREARILKNFSQKELAQFLGRSIATISFWERGIIQIPKDKQKKIEKLLGLPIQFDKSNHCISETN